MATTARLDLSVWRNDETYAFNLRVRGLDLTAAVLRAQVRLAPDTPGAALVDLYTVQDQQAEGLQIVNVSNDAGVPISDVQIRIAKATRAALPYVGEIGQSARLSWVMTINGVTRLVGDFVVLAHALASDSAPANRPIGSPGTAAALPSAAATLTIAPDDGATLTIDGLDAIAPLLAEATAAVENPRPLALADAARKRVLLARGGVYENPGVNQVGAIKVRLPVGIDARKMTARILVTDQFGRLTFDIAGTNNVGQWNYTVVDVTGQHRFLEAPAVRFGSDAEGDCFWIGEADYGFWTDLAVVVLDATFTGNIITEAWLGLWRPTLVTAFDTVTAGPITPAAVVTTRYFRIDTGRLAIALGLDARSGTAASNYNHVYGHYAGSKITTGFNNCLFGLQAGSEITIGSANSAFGTQALQYLTTGRQNGAFGIHALLSATTGEANNAFGAGTMQFVTTGSFNTAFGGYAGNGLITGNNNSFFGYKAGEGMTGSGNVAVGFKAGRGFVGDNRLFIANNEAEELIGGDFATRRAWANGSWQAESFAVKDLNAAPTSSTAPGIKGEMRLTADFIYLCVDTNSWRRSQLVAWAA